MEELQVVESDVSARATELTLKLLKARGSQAPHTSPAAPSPRPRGQGRRAHRQ
jgi:hypothetical protein